MVPWADAIYPAAGAAELDAVHTFSWKEARPRTSMNKQQQETISSSSPTESEQELRSCIPPHCVGMMCSSHPLPSSKHSKNSWLCLTPGSTRAPASTGDPDGQRQCFADVERKGPLFHTPIYLPTSKWSCEDYHIPSQSARYKLDIWQEYFFNLCFCWRKQVWEGNLPVTECLNETP